MEYKTYDCDSYKIYTIKTDRFKSSLMTTIFRNNIKSDNHIVELAMISGCLNEGTKNYKTRRDLAIKSEELYNMSFETGVGRFGSSFEFYVDASFISPEYIKETNYLDECLDFYFDRIMNPNVENEEFDTKSFNIIKERKIQMVKRIHENPTKQALKNALEKAFPDTNASNYMTEEKINKTNPSKIFKTYNDLIEKSNCEIYIIGNFDMDELVDKIKKIFKLKSIKNNDLLLYEETKKRKKVVNFIDNDDYIQANLIVGYNIDKFENKEKLAFRFFSEILCGGLNSKLYQNLREKNSLCYSVRPLYYKYDELYLIHVSLDEANTQKAIKLIKKTIKEVTSGNISQEEFDRAKKSMLSSLNYIMDDNSSILNNLVFYNLGEVALLENVEEEIESITIEDIINVSKKLKLNFTYLLCKGDNNEDNKN